MPFPAYFELAEDEDVPMTHKRVYFWVVKQSGRFKIREHKILALEQGTTKQGVTLNRSTISRALTQLTELGYLREFNKRPNAPRCFAAVFSRKAVVGAIVPPHAADPRVAAHVTKLAFTVYKFLCPRLDVNEKREFATWWIAGQCSIRHRQGAGRVLNELVRKGFLLEHERDHTQGRVFTLPEIECVEELLAA